MAMQIRSGYMCTSCSVSSPSTPELALESTGWWWLVTGWTEGAEDRTRILLGLCDRGRVSLDAAPPASPSRVPQSAPTAVMVPSSARHWVSLCRDRTTHAREKAWKSLHVHTKIK